jgi:hypothetical protein
MRILLLLSCLFFTLSLQADELSDRLRLLLPGDEPEVVNERQFLHQRVSELYSRLEDTKLERKSTKKKIGRIVSYLERNHLKTFASGPGLADAFRSGRYNDATAAILTALALEHFGVDYYGVVDHWQAYLLADPKGEKITILHPGGTKQKEDLKRAFRDNYVELVRSTVAEDLTVRNEQETGKAFSEYFYGPRQQLTFGQLAAYVLYQQAQAEYTSQRYDVSIAYARKASERENRPAFLVIRRAAELQLKAINKPEQSGDIGVFYKHWTENPDNRYLPAAILNHFDEQQQLLLAQNRPDLARRLLDDYASKAPAGSAEWEQELIVLQRYRLLSHYYKQGRLDLAKAEAEALYADEPNNETVRYLLGEIVIDNLRKTTAKGDEFSRIVQGAADRYPFIRKQDRFADLLLRELAWKVRDLYAVDRALEADKSLAQFRKALIDIPIGSERNLWTLTAFYAASDFFFRQKDYGQAIKFNEEALMFSPEDQFLLHRRDLLRRY